MAATAAVNQTLWLRKRFGDLHMNQTKGTEVFVDNQSAIATSHNPVFHGKTEHFNIKLFFLREVQNNVDVIRSIAKLKSSWLISSPNHYQAINFNFSGKNLEFAALKARRSVTNMHKNCISPSSLYCGVVIYCLAFN